jgi:hypothetical protein
MLSSQLFFQDQLPPLARSHLVHHGPVAVPDPVAFRVPCAEVLHAKSASDIPSF